MSVFARLRQVTAGLLGRGVLAWFALAVMAAAAAPLAYAQGLQDICTSSGAPTLAAGADGQPAGGALMHCPLCLPTAPPPPAWSAQPAAAEALSFEWRPVAGIAPAARRYAVPPARAPPMP